MKCCRCGRRLKNPPQQGMGPDCAAAVLGPIPRVERPKVSRKKTPRTDGMGTLNLFPEPDVSEAVQAP